MPDANALTDHARAHGVDARLELYPVDAHVFQLFWSFLPEAAEALQAAGLFVRDSEVREDRQAGLHVIILIGHQLVGSYAQPTG